MTRLLPARAARPRRRARLFSGAAALVAGATALVAVAAGALLAAGTAVLARPAPAWAADQPDSLTITGAGLTRPVTVRTAGQPDLFTALLRQVNWMAGQAGDPIHPDPDTLGPQYVMTVYVKRTATDRYELYPQAPGGPRAHRPAAQPGRTTADAWFYASVAMPGVLVAAGVPLVTAPSGVAASGVAGVSVTGDDPLALTDPQGFAPVAATTAPAPFSLPAMLRGQGRPVLLWLAVPVVILAMLFLAARRARRYRPR